MSLVFHILMENDWETAQLLQNRSKRIHLEIFPKEFGKRKDEKADILKN